jgi:cytoskeletal protein CcmA (bactofilin family)
MRLPAMFFPRLRRGFGAGHGQMSTSDYVRAGAATPDFAAQPTSAIPSMPGAAWVEERTRIAVARNINVSGRLVFQEPVRIEGNFHGEVSSSDLVVISEHGKIEGRVRTPRLLVLGELRGDITDSRLVVLGPRARVFGRIEADSLRVCEGALLEGEVRVPCAGAASR